MSKNERALNIVDDTEVRLAKPDTEDTDSFSRLAASDEGPQLTEEDHRARILEMQAAAEREERIALEPQIGNSFSTGEFAGDDYFAKLAGQA